MLTSTWLRKWTFAQSTESEAHLRYPFPVIRKCYLFPTAKYQLLYWLESVELNQGAELCFLTFLKFLKDKQVLSDRRLPLGSAPLLKAPSTAFPVATKEGSWVFIVVQRTLWLVATGGMERSRGHPFSALFPGLHEATNSLLLHLFQAAFPAPLSRLT